MDFIFKRQIIRLNVRDFVDRSVIFKWNLFTNKLCFTLPRKIVNQQFLSLLHLGWWGYTPTPTIPSGWASTNTCNQTQTRFKKRNLKNKEHLRRLCATSGVEIKSFKKFREQENEFQNISTTFFLFTATFWSGSIHLSRGKKSVFLDDKFSWKIHSSVGFRRRGSWGGETGPCKRFFFWSSVVIKMYPEGILFGLVLSLQLDVH